VRSGTHFEIEIEAHDAAADKVIRVGSEAEVLAFATENLRPGVAFLVTCIGAGVDFGNLIIEVDEGGLCNLRALEHRGFFVRGVSVKQALCALEHWLPLQDRMPSLPWQDE
jgi:hypothetical protein